MTSNRPVSEMVERPLKYASKNGQLAGRIMFELAAQGRLHQDTRLVHVCEALMRAQEYVTTHDIGGKPRAVGQAPSDDVVERLLTIANYKDVPLADGNRRFLRELAEHFAENANCSPPIPSAVASDDVVERVAIRLWEEAPVGFGVGCFRLWNEEPDEKQDVWRKLARAALAAIPSAGGVEEMREALDNFCRAAEYWAGCDEDCCADEAYSEILGSGGAWPAEAYARGRGALEGSPPRSARKHRQMSRVVTPGRGVGR